MRISEINTVCFIGAGTMGCYNSLLAGIAGYDAVVYDISEEALGRVSQGQAMLGDYLTAIGTFDHEQVKQGMSRIRLEADIEKAVKGADLLSESVFETLDLKRQVHRRFDEICPPETILTTNTSSIMVSEIEDVVQRGDRFAAMHFHLGTPLVDVVAGPRTSAEIIDIVTRFVSSLDCVPFTPAKENRGYVFNNLIPGLNNGATALAVEYKENIEDIDRAWMAHENLGPFATMDLIGLNVYYDGAKDFIRHGGENKTARIVIDLLQPYIERGELGIKTGKGFYSYPDPAYGKPGFLTEVPPKNDIYRVLSNGVIIRAIQLAEEGIAHFADIDKIWMINMKSSSGPFGWLDRRGLDVFLSEIEAEERELLFPLLNRDVVRGFLEPYIDEGRTGKNSGKGFYSYPDPVFEETDFLLKPFKS